MPLVADLPPDIRESGFKPRIVVEQLRLHDEQASALEVTIRSLSTELIAFSNEDPELRSEIENLLDRRESLLSPELVLFSLHRSPELPSNWVDISLAAFPGARSMSPEEQAEFDAMSRTGVKRLTKPLKKFSSE
jgi:hypothetical protein